MSREAVHTSGTPHRSVRRGVAAVFAIAIAVGLALALSGCGSATTGSTVVGETTTIIAAGQPGPGPFPFGTMTTYTVSVARGKIDPATLTIPAGSGVLFINAEDDDKTQHQLIADDGSFDTGVLDPGGEYYVTFEGLGTVTYHDALQPDITAEIVIATGDTSLGTAPVPLSGPVIGVRSSGLSAATTKILAGESVTFYNSEDDNTVQHRIVADDGSFDTGVLQPGQAYRVTFDSAGKYPFHDSLDSSIEGTVVVE